MESSTSIITKKPKFDFKRMIFIGIGVSAFCIVYFSPQWSDAVDPMGRHFKLTYEGKASIALFFLASIWWVFEVIPIGITSILIGVAQSVFYIRPTRTAFTDFMEPSVWFIFGSLIIGMTFTKTGITQRMAYKMLALVGERTSMIYLGAFTMVLCLTLVMAHTAVAATVFPLLMAIHAIYTDEDKPTKFGKGLFIGMAFVAAAGSIITLLGSARAAVAVGFFKDMTTSHREVSFFELTYYMLPLGVTMMFVFWGFLLLWFPPEKKTIPGLRGRATALYAQLGPIKLKEVLSLAIVLTAILLMSLRSFIPLLAKVDKTALILITTILFFVFNILDINDLQKISWNIVLLFGGAMSIGLCLWETGAAQWLAVKWLVLFQNAPWFVFVMGIAFFVLLLTNFIMNVAAIAISLPVALVIGQYLHVAPEVIFFTSLAAAGMPLLLLVGAAPNAIAYSSRQFTSGEFFKTGIPATILLIVVLGIFVKFIWPLMGMPVIVK